MQACCELQALNKGLCSGIRCRASSGNNSSSSISSSAWNLSWECLQDRSIAECSFGLEVRNPTIHHKLTPSVSSTSSSSQKQQSSASSASSSSWTRIATGCVTLDRQGSKGLQSGLDLLKKLQTVAVRGVIHSPSPPVLPPNVRLAAVAIVVLVVMLKLKDFMKLRKSDDRGVKTRIMNSQWFKDSRSETGKRKLDEESMSFEASKSSKTDADFPVFDRLVLHDGEVIKSSRKAASPGSILAEAGASSARKIRSEEKEPPEPNVSRIRSFLTRSEGKSRPLFRDSEKVVLKNDDDRLQRRWNDKDEVDLKQRIDELRENVKAAESNRKAAIRALAEERKRSLELEVKIRRQVSFDYFLVA